MAAWSPSCEHWSGQWRLAGSGKRLNGPGALDSFQLCSSCLLTLSGCLTSRATMDGCPGCILHKARTRQLQSMDEWSLTELYFQQLCSWGFCKK